MFFVPQVFNDLLISAMTLTFGVKVKLWERFLLLMSFSLFYQQYDGDFDQNMAESFIDIWHMTAFVDL